MKDVDQIINTITDAQEALKDILESVRTQNVASITEGIMLGIMDREDGDDGTRVLYLGTTVDESLIMVVTAVLSLARIMVNRGKMQSVEEAVNRIIQAIQMTMDCEPETETVMSLKKVLN